MNTYEYPPRCKKHGIEMQYEQRARGKTVWVCDECFKEQRRILKDFADEISRKRAKTKEGEA